MNRLFALFLGASIIMVFAACIDSVGPSKKHGPEDVYFDYKISGEEGNDSVTVLLQFRLGSDHGPTVSIDPPGSVMLDGKIIEPDNSTITGPLYEVTREIKKFTGNHIIVVTGRNSKKYSQEFTFKPFTLLTKLPASVSRKSLELSFNGLNSEDYVRILLTDTSFTGDGINRLDTVINNRTWLTRGDLSVLENGPIQVELIREDEREIENRGYGGIISILYTLRREFFLKD